MFSACSVGCPAGYFEDRPCTNFGDRICKGKQTFSLFDLYLASFLLPVCVFNTYDEIYVPALGASVVQPYIVHNANLEIVRGRGLIHLPFHGICHHILWSSFSQPYMEGAVFKTWTTIEQPRVLCSIKEVHVSEWLSELVRVKDSKSMWFIKWQVTHWRGLLKGLCITDKFQFLQSINWWINQSIKRPIS